MPSSTTPSLFQPIHVGDMQLRHLIVLSPQTRFRCTKDQVPSDLSVEYYRQRACVAGTLLITEATYISEQTLVHYTPGIYSPEQIAAWRKVCTMHTGIGKLIATMDQVTDAVHQNQSFIYAQLWAMGRGAEPTELQKEGFEYIGVSDIALQQDGSEYFGLSNIPLIEKPKPRALTTSGMYKFIFICMFSMISMFYFLQRSRNMWNYSDWRLKMQ